MTILYPYITLIIDILHRNKLVLFNVLWVVLLHDLVISLYTINIINIINSVSKLQLMSYMFRLYQHG